MIDSDHVKRHDPGDALAAEGTWERNYCEFIVFSNLQYSNPHLRVQS